MSDEDGMPGLAILVTLALGALVIVLIVVLGVAWIFTAVFRRLTA
jgi:hypothetical protein